MKLFKTILSIGLCCITGFIYANTVSQNKAYLSSLQQNPLAHKIISTCDEPAKSAVTNYKILYPQANATALARVKNSYINQCVYGQHANTQNLPVPTKAQIDATQEPKAVKPNHIY